MPDPDTEVEERSVGQDTLIDIMTDLYEDVTGDAWRGDGRQQGLYVDRNPEHGACD